MQTIRLISTVTVTTELVLPPELAQLVGGLRLQTGSETISSDQEPGEPGTGSPLDDDDNLEPDPKQQTAEPRPDPADGPVP